jgi:hypothetical protein
LGCPKSNRGKKTPSSFVFFLLFYALESDLTTRFIHNFEEENCFAQNKSETKPVVLGALKTSRNPKEQQKTVPEPQATQPKENDFNRLLNSALSSARKGMEDEAKQRPQKRNAQEMQKFTAKNANNVNNLNKPFPNKNQPQQQNDERGSHRMVRQKVDVPDNSSFPPQATANPFTDPVKYFEQMNEVAQKSGFKNAQEMMSSLAMMNPMAAASYPPPHFPQPYHHQPYPTHPGMYSSAPPPPAYPHPIMTQQQQQQPLPPHPSSYHAYPTYEGGYAGRGGRGRGGEGRGGRFGRGRGRGEPHQNHSSSSGVEGVISEAAKIEGVDNNNPKETVVPTPSDPLQESLPTERDSGAEHSVPNHYPVGGREGRGFYRGGGGRQSYFRGGRGGVPGGGRFSSGHYQTAAPAMSVNSNPFASASSVSTSTGESTQAQAPTAPLFAVGQSTTATAGRGRGGRHIAAAGGRGGNKVWVRPEAAATAAPDEGNK